MIQSDLNNSNNDKCQICKDLLASLHQFLDMLNGLEKHNDNWLTVDEVAKELKISKSIIYRLIKNGELEAINVAPGNDKLLQKGHYRIKRESLDNYLQAKKIILLPNKLTSSHQSRRLYQVKNHLGL